MSGRETRSVLPVCSGSLIDAAAGDAPGAETEPMADRAPEASSPETSCADKPYADKPHADGQGTGVLCARCQVPLYQLEGVVRRHGDRTVLDVPRLDIAAGGITGVVGPNGGGKSTLLRLLALLDAPCRGELRFAGEAVGALSSARTITDCYELSHENFVVIRRRNILDVLVNKYHVRGCRKKVIEYDSLLEGVLWSLGFQKFQRIFVPLKHL